VDQLGRILGAKSEINGVTPIFTEIGGKR